MESAKTWNNPKISFSKPEGDVGEKTRADGTKGSYYDSYEGYEKSKLPDLTRPAIPTTMKGHGYSFHHGGSHAYLTDEFISEFCYL